MTVVQHQRGFVDFGTNGPDFFSIRRKTHGFFIRVATTGKDSILRRDDGATGRFGGAGGAPQFFTAGRVKACHRVTATD